VGSYATGPGQAMRECMKGGVERLIVCMAKDPSTPWWAIQAPKRWNARVQKPYSLVQEGRYTGWNKQVKKGCKSWSCS